ncbi:MAG TPA: hypothetical protein VHC43_02395 [Mycobacteriales bacterium]|nr:hypothetical protein [Mycobacteriales bacterium]
MANQTRVTRLRRAALLSFGAFFPLSWLFAGSAAVAVPLVDPALVTPTTASTAQTVSVGDSAEGWYGPASINLCAGLLACPAVPVPSLYPADTLHFGILLSTETERTYLRPNLSAVPTGSKVSQATMTLPVASGTTDGSVSPDSAVAVACLATKPFKDGADGDIDTPPAVDCHNSAKLTYDAKHNVFTVDVTKFFAAWANGSTENGIAIMPDLAKSAATDLWQVALNGSKRAGTPHVTTSVSFTPPADQVVSQPSTPPSTPPSSAPSDVTPPVPPVTLPDEGDTTAVAPAPVIAPTQVAQPVAFVRHFKYPMAFLFPIALLAIGVFLIRLFTRDATPTKR